MKGINEIEQWGIKDYIEYFDGRAECAEIYDLLQEVHKAVVYYAKHRYAENRGWIMQANARLLRVCLMEQKNRNDTEGKFLLIMRHLLHFCERQDHHLTAIKNMDICWDCLYEQVVKKRRQLKRTITEETKRFPDRIVPQEYGGLSRKEVRRWIEREAYRRSELLPEWNQMKELETMRGTLIEELCRSDAENVYGQEKQSGYHVVYVKQQKPLFHLKWFGNVQRKKLGIIRVNEVEETA